MKIKSLILVAALWIAQSAIAADVLTIEQCYDEARANYPLTTERGLIEQSEQFNLSNAAKGWLPQVSVNAQASYQSDVTKVAFRQRHLRPILPRRKSANNEQRPI
jgi:hypothetical protein